MGKHSGCVDDWATHEWEADRASRLTAAIAFWAWYLPADVLRPLGELRGHRFEPLARIGRARVVRRALQADRGPHSFG